MSSLNKNASYCLVTGFSIFHNIYFPVMHLNLFSYVAATLVQSSLQTANILLRQARQSASRILTEAMQHNRTIYDTTLKYNQIVYSAGNASAMIANASSSGTFVALKFAWRFKSDQ